MRVVITTALSHLSVITFLRQSETGIPVTGPKQTRWRDAVAELPSCRVAELPSCRVAELPNCLISDHLRSTCCNLSE